MGQKGQDTGGKKGAYHPEKRNRIESLRSRPYTNDNELRKLGIREFPVANSWKNLMDENERRELQGKKAFIMRGISEPRVSEAPMEHDEYCCQTKSLNNPPTMKKILNVQNQPKNVKP